MGEGNDGFGLANYFYSYLPSDILHDVKSYDMGPKALFPSKGRCAADFFTPLKIHRLCRV
jgi:hypothetical protein